MNRLRGTLNCAICGMLVLALALGGALMPDGAVSTSERRKLSQWPGLDWPAIRSGSFAGELDSYMLDQIPLRDAFLRLNAWLRLDVLGQRDIGGAYRLDGGAYQLDYPLDADSVRYAMSRFDAVRARYMAGKPTYLAIVPDKNYFVAEGAGYPCLDYGALTELARGSLADSAYIELSGALDISDYYRTDPHWSQERLSGAVDALMAGMGRDWRFDSDDYQVHELSPFYGAYYARVGMSVQPDVLRYLTNSSIEQLSVSLLGGDGSFGSGSVYALDRFDGIDGYDVFLHGAQPVVVLENANAATDDALVVLRDSFGSSIAPLLCGEYARVTLVDIRYISPELLERYVDFEGADAMLVLVSTTLLNSGGALR